MKDEANKERGSVVREISENDGTASVTYPIYGSEFCDIGFTKDQTRQLYEAMKNHFEPEVK